MHILTCWGFSAVLGLCFCAQAFSGFCQRGVFFSCSPLMAGLQSKALEPGPVLAVCGLSGSLACGIFSDWVKWVFLAGTSSAPLDHQEVPPLILYFENIQTEVEMIVQ